MPCQTIVLEPDWECMNCVKVENAEQNICLLSQQIESPDK